MSKYNTDIFIEKANQVHNNKYDYTDVKYINSITKVKIKCATHGTFEQAPAEHIRGKGCSKCSFIKVAKKRTSTTDEFINKARKIHGDTYEYDNVEYISNKTKVKITCKIHGDFDQTPDSHLSGCGCRECGIINNANNQRLTQHEFIERSIQIHQDQYDYSKVFYISYQKNIIITCKTHGDFFQSPHTHLNGSGCPKCTNNNILYSTDEWINLAKQIHKEKYDYSKVKYINSKSKVIIICEKHGEFEQIATAHLRGDRCPKCYGRNKFNNISDFFQALYKVHGNLYDYSKVIYTKSRYKITIICRIHGEFDQIASAHLQGQGCPKCSDTYNYTTSEWIKLAEEKNGNKYDYSEVIYKDKRTKIIINCRKHGSFEQIPYDHLSGHEGCKFCNKCPQCQLWFTYGKLCEYCKPLTVTNKLYKKTKEMKVVNFLQKWLPDREFIHNRSVGRDFTDKDLFPDIRFDCGHYSLIVEIDEFKHRGKSYKCDQQRMYDIIAKLKHPCIFIRYNPDNIKSNKEDLLNKIEDYLDLEPTITVWDDYGFKVEYLFY